jgi:hypothetical protein
VATKIKSIATDAVGLIGVALVSYGAWLVLPAAGFITGGVFLIVGCIFNSRSTAKT